MNKYHQVYTGLLGGGVDFGASGDPHVSNDGSDLWTPQGDITIIGATISAGVNPLPNTALGDLGGVYVYADLSLVARFNEARAQIIRVLMASDPMELPTVGEHALSRPMEQNHHIMFPAGYGIDLDRWHPVYLNVHGRGFWTAGNFEAFAGGVVWYVER